jgi:hypothetical protein
VQRDSRLDLPQYVFKSSAYEGQTDLYQWITLELHLMHNKVSEELQEPACVLVDFMTKL